jgi:16S rRNA (guanine1207-N2)-methyltransferase
MDYHHFREITLELDGVEYHLVSKPGIAVWDHVDPAMQLLSEALNPASTDTVLIWGCGHGLLGLVAAERVPRGHVLLVDDSCVAVEAARRTLALNRITNAEVRLSAEAAIGDPAFDLVALVLPKGREATQLALASAATALRIGGRLLLAGPTRGGVKSAIARMEELFGNTETLRIKARHRVAVAVKCAPVALPPSVSYAEATAEVRGQIVRFVSRPGVFAGFALDEGTRVLIEAMQLNPTDAVLDLGCGSGVVGLIAARLCPQGHVTLVDASSTAVEAARRTLALNGVTNAEVLVSDCAAAVFDREFDVVVTNPPFHQGFGVEYEVARQFILDAARVLRPGGRLYLVANRFIRYDRWIEEAFGNVIAIYEDNRYRVLQAVKMRREGATHFGSASHLTPQEVNP